MSEPQSLRINDTNISQPMVSLWLVTSPKTNMAGPQNDGLEQVVPLKYDYFFGIYMLDSLGCMYVVPWKFDSSHLKSYKGPLPTTIFEGRPVELRVQIMIFLRCWEVLLHME